jgi:hypothetical protein
MRAFIRHPSDVPIEVISTNRVTHALQRLKNISIGGLCYQSEVCLDIGLVVRVVISIVKPPFDANGRVVWCQQHNDGFDVGIQFTKARDLYRVRLVEQACHIEHYKTKVFKEEGRVLSGEAAVLEWMSKYESDFPNLGLLASEL